MNQWVARRVGKLGTDMAVPPTAFPRMAAAYDDARSHGIDGVLFGHLGQYHLHLNFLPEDAEELARAKEIYLGLACRAVALGGTISAEHGVGKKRLFSGGVERPYLYFMYGPEGLDTIARVKRTCDPRWILNPDTVVPRREA